MSHKRCSVFAALTALLVVAPLFGAGPSFVPDTRFQGSSLGGWHKIGQADWRAENGEIIGMAKQGGGWLMLDRSYQDTGFYAVFRCTGGCQTGVLLRAEKTAAGMKGVYLELAGGDLAAYQLTLDAQGKELKREPLRRGGGQVRIAPPLDEAAEARAAEARRRFAGGFRIEGPPGVTLPLAPPQRGLRVNDWNEIEILLDANILRGFLNDGGENIGAVAEDDAGRYGPLALYIGGTGEVRFKDVAYKDLGAKVMPAEQVSSNFRMQPINDLFYSWSAAAADINRDGVLDVIAGPYYYLGPDYTTSREIYLAKTVNPSTEYPTDNWVAHAADFTGDGWPDVLTTSHSSGAGGGAQLTSIPKASCAVGISTKSLPGYRRKRRLCATWMATASWSWSTRRKASLGWRIPTPPTRRESGSCAQSPKRVRGRLTASARAMSTATAEWTSECLGLVRAAGGRRRADMEVPSGKIRPLDARRAGRQPDGGLRRQRRRAQRCGHKPASAWLGLVVVRAETAGRQHFLRRAPHHGRPFFQERGRRNFFAIARDDRG
jgi:hypothetical protein